MIPFWDEANELHAQAIVLDGHADTPQRFADERWEWTSRDIGQGQLSAITARTGGLHGGFLVAWPEPSEWAGRYRERTLALISTVHAQAAKWPQAMHVCLTAADVRVAKANGAYAAMIGVEGGHAIEDNLDALAEFYQRGARYMTLTWANVNGWCGSSGSGFDASGLTDFGRKVVREMNRLGMMVDVSHASDASFADVLETSAVPVIASHSSSRAICGAARNLTDEIVRSLSAKGGVVMVNFFAAFLSDTWRALWNAQRDEREAAVESVREHFHTEGRQMPFFAELAVERAFAKQLPAVPLSVLVDHFDHLLRVAGPEHVGIGSDFDGIALACEGMESAADLPKVTAGLLQRGWKAEELRGMLGENLLRVMEGAEHFSAG